MRALRHQMTISEISLREARQMVLDAQAFGRRGLTDQQESDTISETVSKLGAIQIDSVNVVVRSHYMPLFSRLGSYPMGSFDDLVYQQRSLFEYWGHEASLMPMSLYPLLRHRMEDAKPGIRAAALLDTEPEYIESILREIRVRGPLTVSQLNDPGKRTGPWWGHNRGKVALEWLFATGRLAVADRKNFARVYDLAEKVIPSHYMNAPTPAPQDAVRDLLAIAAKAMGIGTARDIADYYRIGPQMARKALDELVEEHRLARVSVAGWVEQAYMPSGSVVGEHVDVSSLLSPFDSLIWKRDRTERLFGFRYRIEIYVPQANRLFGYYVMPFLMGDQLVARVDLKADRKESTLVIQSAHLGDGQDSGLVASNLATQLREMSQWLGLGQVKVVRSGNLSKDLSGAIL